MGNSCCYGKDKEEPAYMQGVAPMRHSKTYQAHRSSNQSNRRHK